VQGSTNLVARLGDRAARDILALHDEIVREHVGRHEGREIKTLGDGFLIAFRDPAHAVGCAVDIQTALEERRRGDPDRTVRVRMGLNAGDVIESDDDVYGGAVHAAERILGKARGGQILVSQKIKEIVSGGNGDVGFVDRGLFWLKGFKDRWRLYEVAWGGLHGPREEQGRTPYVGREEERADLGRYVDGALAGRARWS
jgi:adenylate cyclase